MWAISRRTAGLRKLSSLKEKCPTRYHHLCRRCFATETDVDSSSSDSSSPSPSSSSSSSPSKLYMWGTNTKGSLPGTAQKLLDVPSPVAWREVLGVSTIDNVTLKQVVCGPTDTAFVLSDGRCYTCGENKSGQLGHGHKNPIETPTLLPFDKAIASFTLGHTSSALIDSEGELYTFGFGGSTFGGLGQLGHGDGETYLTPKLVESLVEDGCYAKEVQWGESHLTVLTTEGEVLTAGAGSYGRLGNFDTIDQLYLEPVELLTYGVVQIAGGKSFTLALTQDGVVHGWGRNHKGQLGTGFGLAVDMYAMSALPAPIEADELAGRRVIKIAAGHSHAAAITKGGELFYWGSSQYLEPVRVTTLLHTKVVDVACGRDYTIALDDKGKIYSFGAGKTGVLGLGSVKSLNQPELVEALANETVVQISAGWSHVACQVEEE